MEKHQRAMYRCRLRAMQESADTLYHKSMTLRELDAASREHDTDVELAIYMLELAQLNQAFTDLTRLYFGAKNDKEVLEALAAARISIANYKVALGDSD